MFRHWRRGWLVRVAAAMLLLATAAGLQHAGKDDFACAPVGAASKDLDGVDGGSDDPPEHCFVCHWTRSLRSPFSSGPQVYSILAATAPVDWRPALTHRAPALDRLPARAPPASL